VKRASRAAVRTASADSTGAGLVRLRCNRRPPTYFGAENLAACAW
jgi:hypothetical protein